TDTGLSENITYWYRIYAYNAGGNSGYAGPISATTLIAIPSAPVSLTANAPSSTQIDLSWCDTSNNEQSFKIERSLISSTTGYSLLATVGSNVTIYSDTPLTPATTFYYRVYAYNTGGNSGYSPATGGTSATTQDVPPVTPTNLITTTVTSSSISLQWTDNSNNEQGFKIELSTDGTNYSLRSTLMLSLLLIRLRLIPNTGIGFMLIMVRVIPAIVTWYF
ncbi:MAG: fibronectin type III domain-containing protein, partial [Planctomycetota bacterium]|nr:fibronectin type III domain-containing protein [Planctomycetota bacterium]